MSKSSKSGEAPEVDKARRRLLKLAAYVPPTIIGTLALNEVACQVAPSCAPSTCQPAQTCMPSTGCMPNTCNPGTCVPQGPCLPVGPCNPNSCGPATCPPGDPGCMPDSTPCMPNG